MLSRLLRVIPFTRKRVLFNVSSSEETVVMHVSDTPEAVYPFVEELIEETSPGVIIHTGDLADNIKLERRRDLLPRYRGAVRKLASILKRSGAKLYVVPGNEDDPDTVREFFGEHLVEPGTVIEIGGFRFALGHKPEDVEDKPADFRLYGHNFKLIEKGLNGVHGVNFILLPSGRTYKVRYPIGTDTHRGYKLWRGM